ncbi:hypothetical protein POM88_043204 [Heracleum sosnowskyi]|uniref:NAC domain-containing protein n=1 Tax=Heracleum sosnowskyi TaxID=360622 RepID=A0AAD8H0L1_9APIA|nr:hypothetical protein POM88_043204 [Heracleum sosnowskyi]
MAERINLAPGFRFNPSDEELITLYLKPKVLGHKLWYISIIKETELFGPKSTPWQLFDVNDDDSWTVSPGNSEKYLYVFTTLTKLRRSEGSKKECIRENSRKKAGCGRWGGKTKRKRIMDLKGNVIGEQRMLRFEINDNGDQFDLGKASHFRMHEYSLAGVNKGLKSASGKDVVLCKITVDSSKDPVYNLVSESPGPTKRDEGKPGPTKRCKGKKRKNKENSEKSVGNNPEGTRNITPKTVVEMDSGIGNNVEAMSKNLFVMDSGISDCTDYLATADQADQFDNVWDPSFTNSEKSVGNNPEGTMNITPKTVVEMDSGIGNNVEAISENLFVMDSGISDCTDYLATADQADQFDNVWDPSFTNSEKSVGNNPEGTRNITPKTVVEMDSGIGNNVEAISENLFVMDSGISDCTDYLAIADQADQFDNVWDPSFTNWVMGLLTSNPEEGAVEDISKLGKRKFEEENCCGSKKICL